MSQEGLLDFYLKRFGRRLRLRDGWRLAQKTLWLALLAVSLVLAAGRLWPIPYLAPIALAVLGIWLLGVVGIALFRPAYPLQTALRVDGELGLKERLSTSLALQQAIQESMAAPQGARTTRKTIRRILPGFLLSGKAPETPRSWVIRSAEFAPELVDSLHGDALAVARQIRPEVAFPLDWLRGPLLAALALALASALLVGLPNPMDRILAERQAVAQAAHQQAQKLENLQKQVQESQGLTPEQQQDLLRKLDELARQLRQNPGDREAALADLSKAEEALRQQLQANPGAQQAALEALAAQLQALSKSQQQRAAGDLSTAGQDLEKLAEQVQSMSESERQALAQTLAQMAARAGQAGDSPLAQALAELSQAAQSGDAQAATQAAQKGAQAFQKAQQRLANQAAIQRALSQVQSSRQAMAQAGQPGSQRVQGVEQGSQQGQNPGQGGSQGQNPGGGGGSQANTLPPFQGSGKANPPTGSKPGSTGADLSGQVYAPQQSGGNKELFIPGQDTGQGTTEERQSQEPLPGSPNPALVPYADVFQRYLDSAHQALDQTYIPAGLKSYVEKYFEQLEP